jgi:hypothetical protein
MAADQAAFMATVKPLSLASQLPQGSRYQQEMSMHGISQSAVWLKEPSSAVGVIIVTSAALPRQPPVQQWINRWKISWR